MNNLNVKMIKKIVIRNVASYDDKGVVFDDLQKVNFIYGGNGSGKTTFGRVLGSEFRFKMYPNCRVEWDGEELPVLVYNKDFRAKNFAENIPGIFTIGDDAVAAEREMERLQQMQNKQVRIEGEARRNLDRCQEERNREGERLVDTLWR